MIVYSFPPVSTPEARILILGSMPGERSLAQQQYYAHPHNSFWPIMSAIFPTKPIETYAQKLELVRTNQLALWDALKACVRPGSLDQAIDKNSIVPNNFNDFFAQHPKINNVFFNGNAAHDIFMRHVFSTLDVEVKNKLTLHKLPSTSPAMASLSRAAKTKEWQTAITRAQASHNLRADGE